MSVKQAIVAAEILLPGEPQAEGLDPRWQALIAVAEFIEEAPEPIWQFVHRWGGNDSDDLRDAIATILLEHLLEHHFESIFPRVEEAVRRDRRFADTFLRCWKFGQTELPHNLSRFESLQSWCSTIA
ncbi:hypothetical protein NA78x_002279 [Anatilimnocola sp. NA78]|uniref:hypothetical protein n=1 Tax=Anatilimnocola sp. NA78 TaxID=3415683 RepID=UPI003CE55C38